MFEIIQVLFSLVLGVLGWKLISCLGQLSQALVRYNEKDRRDLLDMATRNIEKILVHQEHQIDLAQIHQYERLHRVTSDTRVEESMIPKVPPPESPPFPSIRDRVESDQQALFAATGQ